MKVLAGLISSEASLLGLLMAAPLLPLHTAFPLHTCTPGVSLCDRVSSCKDTSHVAHPNSNAVTVGLQCPVLVSLVSPEVHPVGYDTTFGQEPENGCRAG